MGLVVHVIAAIYSEGFHHPDEHFQILEFSNYKLGNSTIADLAWEFDAKTRATLQPFMALIAIKLLNFAGINNPFVWAFVLRLLTGVLAWFLTCHVSLLLIPHFSTQRGKQIFVVLTQTLWFVPYVNVRFSSENLAGIALLAAFYFILKSIQNENRERAGWLILAGMVLGLSFFFRFQMGLAIVGLCAWLIFIDRIGFKDFLSFALAGIFAGLVCVLIDAWFYGEVVLSPLIYFDIQIAQDYISNAGVSPWWKYITDFILIGIPLISIPFLVFLCIGSWRKPTSIFFFGLVPFLLVHMAISHKEMRFMFPMIFSSIYLASIGVDHVIQKYKTGKLAQVGIRALYVVNLVFLVIAIFIPAQEAISYYRFLYHPLQHQGLTLLTVGENPYELVGYEANFYKPQDPEIKVFSDFQSIDVFLSNSKIESVLVLCQEPQMDYNFKEYQKEKVYTLFPDWMLKFNIGNWQERARTWSIYKLRSETILAQ